MSNIHILDRSLNLVGIIDEFVSLIWRPSYAEVGDFELYMGATSKAVALLKKDFYMVRDSDITVDEAGNVTYKKVMIIKNLILNTDVENGDFLTVTGRELKFILHQRIIWTQERYTDTEIEYIIADLVYKNAINPAGQENRKIPNLIHGDYIGGTEKITLQVKDNNLGEFITELCITYNLGWEVYIHNGNMVFELFNGVDRSYNQADNPHVVFCENFENLYNSEYQMHTEAYANTTLIGGEGEGLNRTYALIGDTNAGLDRYEVFTDARDISSNKDTEDEIDAATYKTLLLERGRENLAALAITESFTGEVLSDVSFKYGEDFNLGDVVTVINRYGISANTRVLSAIESEDENGIKLIPQFNI